MGFFRNILLLFLFSGSLLCSAQDGIQNPNVRVWDNIYFGSDEITPRSFAYLDSSKFAISGAYHNFYGSDINQLDFATALRTGNMTLGLGGSFLNTPAYQYYEFSLEASQKLGKNTILSAMLNYGNRSVPEYESASMIDGSIAARVWLSPKLELQMSVLHLYNMMKTQSEWNGLLHLGIKYQVIDRGTLYFIADKNKETEMTGRILFDYDFRSRFGFLAGYQFSPNAFIFGFDFRLKGNKFDFLTSTHPVLGNNYSARYQYEN